jgi:autotransporter-associated beta strand protein
LSVSSLNSFSQGKGMPSSSLGAPMDIEAGEILIGEADKDGDCALIYTGTGEISDRVMNLAGKKATMTFNQSGSGLLKLTSDLLISGYGADKTLALSGDTAGSGELAGNLANPYDRAGKATTAVTKSGKGTWVLSGTNTYSGATTVKQGTLSIASAKSLGEKTDVYVSEGAMLELGFKGEMKIGKLYLDGKPQPAGTYSAMAAPKFIKGPGILSVHP